MHFILASDSVITSKSLLSLEKKSGRRSWSLNLMWSSFLDIFIRKAAKQILLCYYLHICINS
uniref:Uncharacterized protein n=1 Tax=Lepeophtheirus salmonis TaxID=72036 RepID=A0A0K2VI84_LEPSM